ncbi:hypothetical protein CYMTET_49470 [Cymbomonas tetramitiformis]|uniref:Lon N-terminal domain-containing protein n=1 Tax=Cymbomonas tetramitiformis TaxID=36881 RepID=A0AAE0BR90_9CHLO|nr:hypothetical protein CYMTET_49470 [Cymbomonas tetramitiformis]
MTAGGCLQIHSNAHVVQQMALQRSCRPNLSASAAGYNALCALPRVASKKKALRSVRHKSLISYSANNDREESLEKPEANVTDTLANLSALLNDEEEARLKEEMEERTRKEKEDAAEARRQVGQEREANFRRTMDSILLKQKLQSSLRHLPDGNFADKLKTEVNYIESEPVDKAELQQDGFKDMERTMPIPKDTIKIPILAVPYVGLPGSEVRLNLYEPRWVTLFSKLLEGVSEERPGVLVSPSGKNRLDLSRNELMKGYEEGLELPNVIPGVGRMDESIFCGTNQFGLCYRGIDAKFAQYGTIMTIVEHDVLVDGRILGITAQGAQRFKVLRVLQMEPYAILEGTLVEDEEEDQDTVQQMEAELRPAFSKLLHSIEESDAGYMEALELKDLPESEPVDSFRLVDILLHATPKSGLRFLASTSATERAFYVKETINHMQRAVDLGLTPRICRLLSSLLGAGYIVLGGILITLALELLLG